MKNIPTNNFHTFLQGGGEMGERTRNYDWSQTSLGTPDTWPQSLRTSVYSLLNTKFSMFLFWGPEHICFYNDAYRPSLGNEGKHPSILGMPGAKAWPEIWPIIGPMISGIMEGGEATLFEDNPGRISRNGQMEDVYWTYSYSPVLDDENKRAGILVTCTETTGKIITLQNLVKSEARFRSLIEEAPVATCLFVGRDLKIEVANDLMINLWGKDDSVIGMSLEDALPELKGQPFFGYFR